MFLPRKFFVWPPPDRAVQNTRAIRHFAANVDICQMDVVGVAGNDHPLQKLMRVLVNDLAIFERPRLRFVGVADEVNGLPASAVHKRPFQPARKPRAAAATQPGCLDILANCSAPDIFFPSGSSLAGHARAFLSAA